jgi:hypothetical protein
MRSLLCVFSWFFPICSGIFLRVNDQQNALVPNGYQMWWRDDASERLALSGLSRTELCEMKINSRGLPFYRLRDYITRMSDSEGDWKSIGDFDPILDGPIDNKACFRAMDHLFLVQQFDRPFENHSGGARIGGHSNVYGGQLFGFVRLHYQLVVFLHKRECLSVSARPLF